MISQLFGLLVRDLSLILQILLVANQNPRNVFLRMLIYLAHPLWHLGERLSVGDIVSNNNAVGALVITAGDGLESLLSSGIPDLQFYCFAVDINSSNFEIYTNCWHEVVIENIILKNTKNLGEVISSITYGKSQKERWFSNAWVSDKEHFEQVVAVK